MKSPFVARRSTAITYKGGQARRYFVYVPYLVPLGVIQILLTHNVEMTHSVTHSFGDDPSRSRDLGA